MKTKKSTVLFYAPNLANINVQKFFQIDFDIIRDNGYNLFVTDNKWDLFKWWRYDILFIYFYTKGFFRAIPAFLYRKKIFYTGGIDSLNKETETSKRFYLQKIMFILCYMLSTKCIVVSDNDWNNIIKVYKGRLQRKLVKSYHVVNVERFIAPVNNRKKLFISVCWQGAIINIQRKGVDKSLLLFKYLLDKPEFRDFEYKIIGKKGPGTPYLEAIINEYGLNNKVELTGEVSEDEKIRLMKDAKYYFQLSYYEGFGLAALEAMAAGDIVIHSNAGGLKYIVGTQGVIVNIENFEQEYELVYEQILSYDESLLIKAQQRVLNNFNYENRKNDFKSIFES